MFAHSLAYSRWIAPGDQSVNQAITATIQKVVILLPAGMGGQLGRVELGLALLFVDIPFAAQQGSQCRNHTSTTEIEKAMRRPSSKGAEIRFGKKVLLSSKACEAAGRLLKHSRWHKGFHRVVAEKSREQGAGRGQVRPPGWQHRSECRPGSAPGTRRWAGGLPARW